MAQPGMPGSQFPGEDAQTRRVKDLERLVQQFSAANVLATAGIGVIPDGVVVDGQMQFRRIDGTLGVSVDPATGTFVAYSADGTAPVARFGALIETAPGSYGVEVLVGSTWVRLGEQTTTWDSISGKPPLYPPSGHTHGGGDITSAVANATNAVNAQTAQTAGTATTAGQASNAARADETDGVTPEAFTRVVGGVVGTWHAMYMHSNGDIGRGSSGEQYKRNIRDALTDEPLAALNLRVRKFDRRAEGADDYTPPVSVDELGLIAQEVAEVIPELVTYRDGVIDGVRHEIGWVTLIPVAQNHETRIAELERMVRQLGGST